MLLPHQMSLLALCSLGSCTWYRRSGIPTPKSTVTFIGNTTTNAANVYRDGGGGGKISGINFIHFSDTETTNIPIQNGGNLTGFESNSLAVMGYHGAGPQSFFDFVSGNGQTPMLHVPWGPTENNGANLAIWPNSNIATACNGACGIAYVGVYNRSANNNLIYTTGMNITVNSTGFPTTTRPVESILPVGVPYYGKFSVLSNATEQKLYLFATVGNVTQPGLKMARVAETNVFNRSAYEYWNGTAWSVTMPPRDDPPSNMFNWTDSNHNQPTSGEVFWSSFYSTYMVIFGGGFGDQNVYMSYSTNAQLTGSWTKAVSIYQSTPLCGGGNQNFHVYPHFDETQRVVPLGFTSMGCYHPNGVKTPFDVNAWANITFS